MKVDIKLLEKIVLTLIFIALSFTYLNYTEKGEVEKEDFEFDEESFEDYPLVAWRDTHKKWNDEIGDVVKIRYRVKSQNTKIWVIDSNFVVVHEQSLKRDPKPDGTPRDFTWTWKLYKSERTQYIKPGNYTIVVGGMYKPTSTMGKLTYDITI